ncbi:MAG: flagellar basal body rod protein FlgB [Nitrospirae bacterium]|nr:flagellar basal body rod protein FlgB [Nitrospirota bacterium]
MPISIFDNTVSFLSRALDMMSERHKLLASNIANQDTPDYKAMDINFAEELRAVAKMQSQETLHSNTGGAEDIKRTDPGHMDSRVGSAYHTSGGSAGGAGVRVVTRPDSVSGYDNNSVNVELEMANMAQNTILYNAAAQIISTKFKMIAHAIREGR